MDEAKLIDKLRKIEALFAGATTDGEQEAADRARQRILDRLAAVQVTDPPVEFRFSMPDMWRRRLFVALLRRYSLSPYRFVRQRHTTVMVRVSRKFCDETLWPEYLRLSEALEAHLADITARVVGQVIHGDSSDVDVVQEPLQIACATSAPAG